jgi:c-di-GMP-binding flagellar brake protein YcgR
MNRPTFDNCQNSQARAGKMVYWPSQGSVASIWSRGQPSMADSNNDALLDAIARNAGIVLSLPSAGMLRHHKSRFLSDAPDGFWVESVPGEASLIDSLVISRQPAGISFKNGPLKVVFATPIEHRQPVYRINADTQVEALLLGFPTTIKAIQRRSNYRVRIPAGSELSARAWRIPEHAYLGDRPMAAQEIPCELRDLSTGGIGLTFKGKDGQPVKVSTADRLRIELYHADGKILLEGRMRHPVEQSKQSEIRAGVQFKALENNLDGRQILAQLTRIVGELQREEVRRLRLGLCNAG